MSTIIRTGNNTSGNANVDDSFRLEVVTEKTPLVNPAKVGAEKTYFERDTGAITGAPYLLSPEVDRDSRLRITSDLIFDVETFNYTAQNTGKHIYRNATMSAAWTAAGFITNNTNITTTGSGVSLSTYAEFPFVGATSLYCEMIGSFTASPTTNTVIDFGLFRPNAANPFAPADGVCFRLTAAGLLAVVNSNGTEITAALTFTYVLNKKYQFTIVAHEREVEFWIDTQLYARIATPDGQGQPFMSTSLPFSLRHAIVGGAAGAALSFALNDVVVSIGGLGITSTASVSGQRIYGSYQGLSGGTMGSLANYVNNTNPAATVPTNTAASLGTGLGGQFWETDTLAAGTDGIIMSYQVPLGTVNIQGRRLVLRGIKIDSFVQTGLTGGGYNAVWSLAFGHTAVSLATTETATSKARRVIPLGVQTVASGAVATTQLSTIQLDLGDAPVFVNPGEFLQICKKKVGTAPSAGVIAHIVTLMYGWE